MKKDFNDKKNWKNKVFCLIFMIFLVAFLVLSVITPDKDVSESERRKLTQAPKITFKTVFNGKYYEELDKYLVDQFPFRDNFRKLKGIISNKIFLNRFDNDVFIENGRIYQVNFDLDQESVEYLLDLINQIIRENIKSEKIYYSIIPDKNYYLDKRNFPTMDYEKMLELMKNGLKDACYIPLFDCLNLDSYYTTDIHWKQEELFGVLNTLGEYMNFNSDMPKEAKRLDGFYGSLYSKISSNVKSDSIVYLCNDTILQAKVFDYEKDEYISVYNESLFTSIDPYNIYLGGAKPLLVIENENCSSDRELVLFRDSFASSISPLLIENYKKITMIDLRYFSSSLLENIEFNENQEILFLYSTTVINNSYSMR